jgi:ATP-dependent RNA helicase RhlE
VRALRDLNFTQPTPVQEAAIPPALLGRDVLASAATGSGKTAAYGLPLLERLAAASRGTTRALVLAPTRELAAQITSHLTALAGQTGIRVASVYGGVGFGAQAAALRRGTDVIVATPGRLLDHFEQRTASLREVDVLVVDEADRMLDMGFLPDVRRILAKLPAKRQTLFFSATLPPAIVKLAGEMLHDPVRVDLAPPKATASGIEQTVYAVDEQRKADLFVSLLKDNAIYSALAFTRTKARANRLAATLVKHNISAERIHGNRSQAQRTRALHDFKSGRYRVLVATDLASRGIDIADLGHVINYDVPAVPEDYIHRVGRTARMFATGDAITFVTPAEERLLAQIERSLGHRLRRAANPPLPPLVAAASIPRAAPQPAHKSRRTADYARGAKTR